MAIDPSELATNYAILQAASRRVSQCILLEESYRTGKHTVEEEELDYTVNFINALKAKFIVIKGEIITLLNSLSV